MASVSGTLTEKISSTVSSPTVNYAVQYTASRADTAAKTVSVRLTFGAWLNSAASQLGTGIKLTVFVRMNGGAWQSAVIKATSASWKGTAKHTASLTLSAATTAGTAKIEWYVSRTGSTYSGSAGMLGNAAGPKSGTVTLPSYSTSGSSNVTETVTAADTSGDKYLQVKVGGAWQKAIAYVKVSGVWQKTAPYVKSGGVWKAIE